VSAIELAPDNSRAHQQALDEAETAVLAPADGVAHELLGMIFERARRFSDAASSLRQCVDLLPKSALRNYAGVGRVLVFRPASEPGPKDPAYT
jgi:Flp pilus assembly protein TadD